MRVLLTPLALKLAEETTTRHFQNTLEITVGHIVILY